MNSGSGGIRLAPTFARQEQRSVSTSGPISGTVAVGYDAQFRVASRTVNGGGAVSFGYDNDGLLIQAGALSLARNAASGLRESSSLAATTDERTRTDFGELDTFTGKVGGTPIYSYDLDRDAIGRITKKTETLEGSTTVWDYAYHPERGWLTEVKRNGDVVASYAYDGNGNRTSWTDGWGSVTATYDAQDRQLSAGATTYTYTANGERLTKQQGTDVTTYEYDVRGALLGVDLPNGIEVDYLVDANGRRVGKRVEGTLVQGFLYAEGLAPVAETDGSGAIVSTFVYGSSASTPEYFVRGGITYRIFSDHLGSPRLVVEAGTGEDAQVLTYDAFGRITYDSNPGFQPFGFAGGLYDRQTGLTRFGARDYDPESARWTAKDPIGFAGGDPNLYGYVFGDVINLTDPSGKVLPVRAAAWAVAEVGFSLWDLYDTYKTLTDPYASGSEKLVTASGALLGMVAPGGGYGTGARLLEDALDFTAHRKSIRKGLTELTGGAQAGAHAHHMFPVKFGDDFVAAGIDVNDPRYGAWWEATAHLQNARGYNDAWEAFLVTKPGREEILNFGRRLAADYGLTIHY